VSAASGSGGRYVRCGSCERLHTESLKALLAGGVSFATPPRPGHTVSEGSVFPLHHEAKKDWMEWETDFEPQAGDEHKHHFLRGLFHHGS